MTTMSLAVAKKTSQIDTKPFSIKLPCGCTYRLESIACFIAEIRKQINNWIKTKWSEEFCIYFCYKHRNGVQYSYEQMINKIDVHTRGRFMNDMKYRTKFSYNINCPNSRCPNYLGYYILGNANNDIWNSIQIPCLASQVHGDDYRHGEYCIKPGTDTRNILLTRLDGRTVEFKDGRQITTSSIATHGQMFKCTLCTRSWCEYCIVNNLDPDGHLQSLTQLKVKASVRLILD